MAGFGEQKEKKKSTPQAKTIARGEVFYGQAIAHHLRGDLTSAETAYREAIKTGYSDAGIFINLGVICKNNGQSKEALLLYEKAIEISPDNPDAYSNIGSLYLTLGQLDQALASTLKSLELKSDNSDAHLNLGGIYKELGQLDLALASTLKSLELKSDNFMAYVNLGGIYKGLGQLDQALASTLKSLELKSDNFMAYLNLGGIYKDLGQLDQALASTLKFLDFKSDSPMAYVNLGGIYQELGQLDQALSSTLKSLEIKPDYLMAHMNLGMILNDLGQLDQACIHLREAMKSEKIKEEATIELAQNLYVIGRYRDALEVISEIHNKSAKNLRLSLYLCLDQRLEFNRCANDLLRMQWLDQRGVAAIDHANVIYSQDLDNGLGGSTIDSVFIQKVDEQEFSDELIEGILMHLSSNALQYKSQELLDNGSQTSGNILDVPEKPFQALKELLIQKIDNYNQSTDINADKLFKKNLRSNMYILRGWAIVIAKGGSLKPHNHERGWLTGTFYLQMPEQGDNPEEGAIEFSHQGPRYPEGASVFDRRVIRPTARDLNIFSSSLFHRTLPFNSEMQRVCIAFDVTRNVKRWKATD